MYSSQIDRALNNDKFVSGHFMGVFPCDLLPKQIKKFPAALIANTDPSSKKGEHWVAYYFDKKKNSEYFDSYGFPPINGDLFNCLIKNSDCSNITCNDVQLQDLNSEVCGHYCIAFIARKARGESMKEIVESYRGTKPGFYDNKILDII